MEQAEFDKLKVTFPWREHIQHSKQGGIVQILDKQGLEVPLFTITKFLEMITARLAAKESSNKDAT